MTGALLFRAVLAPLAAPLGPVGATVLDGIADALAARTPA